MAHSLSRLSFLNNALSIHLAGSRGRWFKAWLGIGMLCPLAGVAQAQIAPPDPARYAAEIDQFAQEDADALPEPGGTVIVGSSSVRLLAEESLFPDHELINRGFGGSHISDINHYLDQTVLKYAPSRVIFFCGNNDLWYGRSVPQVVSDFNTFRDKLFSEFPTCQLVVLALRPTPQHISIIDQELAMNDELAKIAATDPRITFLRGSCDRFIDANRQPIPAFYDTDQLHMSPAGYEIWKEILTPILTVEEPALAP